MLTREDMEGALFEGDCLDIMRRFPDSSVDMVLCDLPYGTTRSKWDSVIDLDALWKQYRRIVKPAGAIVLTSAGLFTCQLGMSAPDLFKYKWVWEKSTATNFLNAKKQPLRKHEDVCVFYRSPPVYHPQWGEGEPYFRRNYNHSSPACYGSFMRVSKESEGSRYPTDIIKFTNAKNEGEVFHPNQKPVALGRYLVRTYTDPGALVLDNAFGSGSFLVSAAMEDRAFCGIELNQWAEGFKGVGTDYIAVAEKRLKEAGADVRVHRRDNPRTELDSVPALVPEPVAQ